MTHRRREEADRDVDDVVDELWSDLEDAEPVEPSDDDVGEGWE